jgi:hypothetical protein
MPQGRPALPFRHVNRSGSPEFDPGMQRHHLLPCQLLDRRCFGALIEGLGRDAVGFDDFRRNGMLLPTNDAAVLRIGLPLHRGPHRAYNLLVVERVGQIERTWSASRRRAPERVRGEALMRLGLLQRGLRRRLLDPLRRRFLLHLRDPLGREADFAELDAMVDQLWGATELPQTLGDPNLAASSAFASEYCSASRTTRSATDSSAETAPTP